MSEQGLEYSVQTLRHARGWIVVPVVAGGMFTIRFVLNTGYLISAVNSRAQAVLAVMGLLDPIGGRLHSLRNLTLAEQPLPDLEVRATPALGLIGVEGILGLNFLRQFDDVHFNLPSRRLTLHR